MIMPDSYVNIYTCVCEYPCNGFIQWEVKKMKVFGEWTTFFVGDEIVEQIFCKTIGTCCRRIESVICSFHLLGRQLLLWPSVLPYQVPAVPRDLQRLPKAQQRPPPEGEAPGAYIRRLSHWHVTISVIRSVYSSRTHITVCCLPVGRLIPPSVWCHNFLKVLE